MQLFHIHYEVVFGVLNALIPAKHSYLYFLIPIIPKKLTSSCESEVASVASDSVFAGAASAK